MSDKEIDKGQCVQKKCTCGKYKVTHHKVKGECVRCEGVL